MAFQKEYQENSQMTQLLNHPGLIIVDDADWDGENPAVFTPLQAPECDCGKFRGKPDGYQNPKTVYDIPDGYENKGKISSPYPGNVCGIPDDYENEGKLFPPQIITITMRQRRYICPKCKKNGEPKEIPYEPDFVRKGEHNTKRLNNYIGNACLNRSPEKVADSLGGVLSKSAVSDNAKKWAEARISDYKARLTAPKELGVHRFEVLGNKYYLISDVENGLIIDIFQCEDFVGMLSMLLFLAQMKKTSDVLSEVNFNCLFPVRGVFKGGEVIRASVVSLFREYSNELIERVEREYSGRGKQILKSWLATPLFQELPIEPEVNRIQRAYYHRKSSTPNKNDVAGACINEYYFFRKMVQYSWDKTNYDEWYRSHIWVFLPQNEFRNTLILAEEEIQNSFEKKHLQEAYNDAEEQVYDIIMQNQKCGFELMRYRLLLTCNPQIIPVPKEEKRKYFFECFYQGINIKRLSSNLHGYED